MDEKLDIALIGCGKWGQYILRDLTQLDCNVHVIARTNETVERAKNGGASSIHNSTKTLPNVNGVVIATPTSTHLQMIEEIEYMQVPIFCEKPLGDNAEFAATIVDRIGDRLFVMDKWRYHEGILQLAHIARTKELGDVQGLTLTRANWRCPHPDVDCVWTLAPHDLSIAKEILGNIPHPKLARATLWNNEIATLHATLGDTPWVNLTVSKLYPKHQREVRLECTEGVALLSDAYSDNIAIYQKDGLEIQNPDDAVTLRPFSNELPLLRELRAFINYINGGTPPKSNAYEALATVQIIQKLRSMALSNKDINVNSQIGASPLLNA